MDNTITLQGSFVATGNNIIIPIRCGVDWMRVYNYTNSNVTVAAPVAGPLAKSFYWQRGMADNDAFITQSNAAGLADFTTTAAASIAVAGTGGFTFIDSSIQTPGPVMAYTGGAGSNATPPVLTVASTAGLSTGNIVRITTSATAYNASGIDYSIEVLNGTMFSLRNMSTPGSQFGAGTYRVIAFNPIIYPPERVISNMTPGLTTVIATTVDHGYLPGQQVRIDIPQTVFAGASIFGGNWYTLDGVQATVISVTAATAGNPATFTVNINSTGFGTFTWPVVANVPFTPAQVVAIGEYVDRTIVTVPPFPQTSPWQLIDATQNRAIIGMQLTAGANAPGGAVNNVMYWQAGAVFSTTTLPLVLPL